MEHPKKLIEGSFPCQQVGAETRRERGVEWASKHMFVLGLVVVGGLLLHLFNFWYNMQWTEILGDHVNSLGFGRKLESDFLDEGTGYVPSSEYYDRAYHGSWNALTVISLSIGQGELGCTPLQMANLAAIIANRGYCYIPHIVRSIGGRDSLDARFYEKHYTKVDPRHFETIVQGMWRGVHVDGTSRAAYLEGYDVCGKTGTAQNPRGRDHSTFLTFAPKDRPRIALSVYVENGGFGAAAALPIASLLEELYLTDTIRRPELVQRIKNMSIQYPVYDR